MFIIPTALISSGNPILDKKETNNKLQFELCMAALTLVHHISSYLIPSRTTYILVSIFKNYEANDHNIEMRHRRVLCLGRL